MSEKICPQCGKEYPADQRFCPTDGTPLRPKSNSADLVGQVIADRFHVLKTLGEGGMGRVYLAEHVRMGRKCALKVMSPRMASDPEAISRFNREAANACKISHPNVAAVYDFGETSDGLIYLAMEYVEGMPLTDLVQQQPNGLAPMRAANITKQVADALGAAHDLGIVHRDLKPDNIMIARDKNGADVVKVVDFGIAKVADNDAQKVTKTGLVVGTPEYMSPEQLSGDKVDGRSDIYSLALVAFNMLTGTLPFAADSQQETMIMRLTDKPKRLDQVAPDREWTAEVQAVLDRALERDAKNRYQSAPEMGRDFALAVDWMPETQAANAGTMVMDAPAAVPSGPAAAAKASDATTVLPRTSVSERNKTQAIPDLPVPPRRTPALVPEQKRGVPMWVIGLAVVVVIGGGALALKLNQGPGVTQAGAAQSDSVGLRARNDTTVPQSIPFEQLPIGQSLDSVRKLTTPSPDSIADVGRGGAAVPLIEGLMPRLTTHQDSITATFLLGRAHLMKADVENGCRILRRIRRAELSESEGQQLTVLLASCPTP